MPPLDPDLHRGARARPLRRKAAVGVGTNCVEVDPVVWQSRMLERIGFDWSDQPSGQTLDDVSPTAIEVAPALPAGSERRRFRHRPGQRHRRRPPPAAESGQGLARAHKRGVAVVRGDSVAGGRLHSPRHAGGRQHASHRGRRAAARASARGRTGERGGQPPDAHGRGFRPGQGPGDPFQDAARGHRERSRPPRLAGAAPTVIEHVGDTLTVTSSGGFVGGVTPDNIITHPAVPRYREPVRSHGRFGLAEREGIGVDRMVRDMLAIGRPAPVIAEIDGPHVRVVLLGGDPDAAVIRSGGRADPRKGRQCGIASADRAHDTARWVDAESAAPLLQRSSVEEADQGDPQTGGCALGRRRLRPP